MSVDPESLPALLDLLDETLADARLSDEEKRSLIHSLREASPPEEGLRQLRNRAFDLVRQRTTDPGQLSLLKWLDGVVRALDVARNPVTTPFARAYFSPGPACREVIQQQLRGARSRIDLCVFTLSDDRITEELLAAFRRGVAVRVITDNDKESDRGSDIESLRRAGLPLVVDRTAAHMHHKFALFDEAWLINGSYNWTHSAATYNEENIVLTNDAALVRQFTAQFQALWTTLQ